MSEEMAKKKKEEEELFEKQETEEKVAMREDICPHCGFRVTTFDYLVVLPPPYLWIECAACGVVFCPASIRKMKAEQASSAIQRPSSIVLASK